MANSDTILALNGFGSTAPPRNQLTSLTALGTSATYVTMGSDSGSLVTAFLPIPGQSSIFGTSNPMSVNVNTATMADQLGAKAGERGAARPWFNQLSFDGRALRVRLQGKVTSSAASNTFTVTFYMNTAANGPVTAGAGTIAAVAMGGAAMTATSGSFIAEAAFEWDSVSAKVQGAEAWGAAAGFYAARAVGQSTPFAMAAPLAGAVLFAQVTFATGAANVVSPSELSFEDV